MPQYVRYLVPFLGAILIVGDAAGQTPAATPEPVALLREMEQTYAAAKSYADTSTATYRNRDGTERLTVTFRIWFARPTDFRVDAESKRPGTKVPRREVLWSNGAITRTWATDKAVASLPKVQIAKSGMFGTYAYHIPTLLEASYGAGRRLQDLTEPQVAGEDVFENVPCHRVRGQWEGDAYEVWLGKDDHLVHKIIATYADHELEEIHREIALDQPIPKETFRFAPEAEASPKKR